MGSEGAEGARRWQQEQADTAKGAGRCRLVPEGAGGSRRVQERSTGADRGSTGTERVIGIRWTDEGEWQGCRGRGWALGQTVHRADGDGWRACMWGRGHMGSYGCRGVHVLTGLGAMLRCWDLREVAANIENSMPQPRWHRIL